MASVQEVIASLDDGAITITLTYDNTTFAWGSISAANNSTRSVAFTASLDGTQKSWTFTLAPNSTTSHAVPKNISLAFAQDPTTLALFQNAFTLTVH